MSYNSDEKVFFDNLTNYPDYRIHEITPDGAIEYLNKIYQYYSPMSTYHNSFDYEYLIFIKHHFRENELIQEKCDFLFGLIAEEYWKMMQLLAKLTVPTQNQYEYSVHKGWIKKEEASYNMEPPIIDKPKKQEEPDQFTTVIRHLSMEELLGERDCGCNDRCECEEPHPIPQPRPMPPQGQNQPPRPMPRQIGNNPFSDVEPAEKPEDYSKPRLHNVAGGMIDVKKHKLDNAFLCE